MQLYAQEFGARGPQITGIIFDIGKVLLDYDDLWSSKLLNVWTCLGAQEVHRRLWRTEEGLSLWHLYFTGQISTQEFYKRVLNLLDTKKETLKEGFLILSLTGTTAPNREMWPLIEELDQMEPRTPRFIISNNTEIHWVEGLRIVPEILTVVQPQKTILSHVVGLAKPDPHIFMLVCDPPQITPDKLVLIDDNLENINAFIALGGQAIQYDCSKDKIEDLRQALVELGLLR